MMLQTCTAREIWRDDSNYPLEKCAVSSSCKLQTPLLSPLKTKLFLGSTNSYNHHRFVKSRHNSVNSLPSSLKTDQTHEIILNSDPQNRGFSETKVSQGFKKERKYGGILPSILRSLDRNTDIEETLNSYGGTLSPKELTVILKQQSTCDRVVRVFEWMKSKEEFSPNVIHYNIVLRALGRAQKWAELRLCWIEMAKNGISPTNNTYGMLVDVYGKAGLVKEALLWIKHMKIRGIFPDEVTMNTVIRVLKDAKYYDKADRFYKDWCLGRIELNELDLDSMNDSQPFSLKNFLSTELLKTGYRDPYVKNVLKSNGDSDVRKPRLTATYNTLIDLFGKAGRLKDAAEVLAEMLKSGVAVDTTTFNTMIYTCGSHGHLLEAETLLTKMEEKGLSPDTKTYNIFISLYADAGNFAAALKCYQKIREVGLFPNDVTYRAILHILCERKLVREVEAVIDEMENCGSPVDESSLPVIIKMYVDKGLLDRAMRNFEKGRLNGELSPRTYEAIIDVYAEKGLWTEAETIFYSERDRKGVAEYNVMIKAYGKVKLHDKAFSLFMGMKNQGIWPDECTYNSLIQMLSGGDTVDGARELLAEMQRIGYKPSCQTYSSIIGSYACSSRLSDSVNIYEEMIKNGVEPNEVVYGSLIDGFAEAGRVDEALLYFSIMEKKGIIANQVILTSLIKAYSKVNSLLDARRVYEKIKGLKEGPDIIASNSMINLYAHLGMVSEARSIFNDLRDTGLADGVTYATMMYLYKNMGLPDEAIKVADEMKCSGLLRDCFSFNKAMACYATNGDLIECAILLHKMMIQQLLPDNGTFKVLFTVLKKADFPVDAVKQLELCYHESKPYSRDAVIACVFLVTDLHDLAIEFVKAFAKPGIVLDLFAYNVAIYFYGALGEVERALNMFMKMQDEGLEPDIVTYINLVGCYGKAGMVEGVKRVYGMLKFGEIEPSLSLLKAVVDAYKCANRQDLAELVSQEMRFGFETQWSSDSGPDDNSSETYSSVEDLNVLSN